MTIEKIKNLDRPQLEERAAAIAEESKSADKEALELLNAEMDAIEARKLELKERAEARKAAMDAIEARKLELKERAEARKAAMDAVKNGAGDPIAKAEKRKDDKAMETRNSKAYIDAFANYVKTGDDTECRALLTENVDGGAVPVPEFVEGRVRTAWENDEIIRRISKTYLPGNVKIGFEVSATDAVVHVEGTDAPPEESLVLGIVNLVPQSIKKWIRISDEVMDLGGQEFLDYIYDELTYKIVRAAANALIQKIESAPATSSGSAPGVPVLSAPVAASTSVQAEALLSDEATTPVAIMHRQTYAAFKSITTTDGYLLQDPFDGMEVIFNNSLPVYSTADAGATYMIVGSLENGARANFPRGEEVAFKFDELTFAEDDLVKVVGRMYAAIGVVSPDHFVKVQKPSA